MAKPNIVLFLVDDLGWKDLGCYGSDLYQTPNTDALADSGIMFTNAYAAAPVCSPTRASILTGKYPATINTTDWIKGHHKPFAKYLPPKWDMHIKANDTTLAEVLQKMGYRTIHIGKWHLGEAETDWPEHHGFDKNIGGWKKGMPNKKKNKGGYFSPYFNPRLEDGPEGEYLTERLAKEASKFIDSNKDKPFFLNFWLYNVHTPLQAKKEKIAKYNGIVKEASLQSNPTYTAMVEHMDDALGVVVSQLKKSGIYDNTIIVFASDNGGLLGTKGKDIKPKITSNFPLRSGKGSIYEGGVRTPFIISWPKKIKARKTDVVSISPDIFPTLIGLINNKNETNNLNFDGIDLSPFLLQNLPVNRDAIFWHYPHYHAQGAKPFSAIRKGSWKLIQVYEEPTLKLYNLETDISEKVNLIQEYPAKGHELLNELNTWKQEVGAQEPILNPNYDPKKS
ncbi:sulfatase [Gaetbulibacter sp. M240]|uniref:sulfatase n=1 Tax=Gaetbulibacter sp. M240 TaxID=3126511 RepID=UPI00374E889D